MNSVFSRSARATFVAALFVSSLCAITACGGSDTSGTGGGGAGGAGGSGTGGAGGQSASCIEQSAYADLFKLSDPSFCVVALYDADEAISSATWGAHGGPLTLRTNTGGAIDLVRWQAPAGATGSLTFEQTTIPAMIPDGAFVGTEAVDLPFFGWTAISWSGAFPNTQGEVVLIEGKDVAKRYAINGAYAVNGVASGADAGRLLTTGLSPIGDAMTNANAFYAADSCGTAANPELLPGMDPNCAAPSTISAWGDASGPIAIDRDGNVFVVMSSFAGDQEARGFAASSVARGAAPTDGATIFTMPGFGSSLAALAPADGHAGTLVFQPYDPMTFDALDVVAVNYSANATAVQAEGSPSAFIDLTTNNTAVSLFRDDQDRLWITVPQSMGTKLAVIDRAP